MRQFSAPYSSKLSQLTSGINIPVVSNQKYSSASSRFFSLRPQYPSYCRSIYRFRPDSSSTTWPLRVIIAIPCGSARTSRCHVLLRLNSIEMRTSNVMFSVCCSPWTPGAIFIGISSKLASSLHDFSSQPACARSVAHCTLLAKWSFANLTNFHHATQNRDVTSESGWCGTDREIFTYILPRIIVCGVAVCSPKHRRD